MARVAAISKEEVASAFEKLLSEGNAPSAENIHALLGKGSLGLINRFIKEIIQDNNRSLLTNRRSDSSAKEEVFAEPAFDKKEATLDLPFDSPREDAAQEPQGFRIQPTVPDVQDQSSPKKKRFEERRFSEPEIVEAPLEFLSEETLAIKVRRLESMLLKEQARREASERIALSMQTYAESIKEQVSERINDLRQTMEVVIEQLKQQLKEQKQNYEQDLKFYREQIQKANKKLSDVL